MADRSVDQLSGGELQRVWLATCLAQETGVLLLDEPTNHLDLRYQVEILDLMRDLADDHGTAVGVVLHDLNHAAAVADDIVLLSHGRIRSAGTCEEVFTAEVLTEVYGLPITTRLDDDTGIDPDRGTSSSSSTLSSAGHSATCASGLTARGHQARTTRHNTPHRSHTPHHHPAPPPSSLSNSCSERSHVPFNTAPDSSAHSRCSSSPPSLPTAPSPSRRAAPPPPMPRRRTEHVDINLRRLRRRLEHHLGGSGLRQR